MGEGLTGYTLNVELPSGGRTGRGLWGGHQRSRDEQPENRAPVNWDEKSSRKAGLVGSGPEQQVWCLESLEGRGWVQVGAHV